MKMKDPDEFKYARTLVFDALKEIGSRPDLPRVAQSLTTYVRRNIEKFLKDSTERSDSYCACLTVITDHRGQWKTYAENGNGFAIGLDMRKILEDQCMAVNEGKQFVWLGPVIYDKQEQRAIVEDLVKTGIRVLQTFAATCSERPQDLTAFRDQIKKNFLTNIHSYQFYQGIYL